MKLKEQEGRHIFDIKHTSFSSVAHFFFFYNYKQAEHIHDARKKQN